MNQPYSTLNGRKLAMLAVAAALAGAFATTAGAADEATSRYVNEKTNCETGNTQQDKATCLKEAAAALDEKRKGKLDNQGTPMMNATERCNALPQKEKADCFSRILGPASPNQTVTTSGSVAGGGVIKETKTTTPGELIVIQPAPAPTPVPAPAPQPEPAKAP